MTTEGRPTEDFLARIKRFNQLYGLPAPSTPVFKPDLKDRLVQFKAILTDEVNEVDDIIAKLEAGGPQYEYGEMLDILTMLSDWLGDTVVYCVSEMQRHGLPSDAVLNIIMDSNDSKLGADGQPIVKDGKVQKGPNYWKPEPKIASLLDALIAANSWSMK